MIDLSDAIAAATARIAPTWPLDRFIAVNPLWGFRAEAMPRVAARVGALRGAELLPSRQWLRGEWEADRLRGEHLRAAIDEAGATVSVGELVALLGADAPAPRRWPLAVALFEPGVEGAGELPPGEHVVDDVARHAALHFGEGQASIGAPESGLYAAWRDRASDEPSHPAWLGGRAHAARVAALPEDPAAAIAGAVAALGVPADAVADYLTALLLDVNGWAAWCAYRRWTARLEGDDDDAIVQLLAIRAAWDQLAFAAADERAQRRWRAGLGQLDELVAENERARRHDWLLLRAAELAAQGPMLRGLLTPRDTRAPSATSRPELQAAFCIDVRSEVLRRALEGAADDRGVALRTMGFAGFFGVPMSYAQAGSELVHPHLPGLLAPAVRAADTGLDDVQEARRARLADGEAWKALQTGAISTFSFVEAHGLTRLPKLLGAALGLGSGAASPRIAGLRRAEQARRAPRLVARADGAPLPLAERVAIARRVLAGLGLGAQAAPLVALVGHGSHTTNNPHAAGYDCGACSGQAGDVNARVTVALLDDPEVRAALRAEGHELPDDTRFVAGLHETTTDTVTLFDTDALPASHRERAAALAELLAEAGRRARRERAPRLGLPAGDDEALRRAVERRARDWAEVRPEWGLAGNAAFIVAPREHVRHLDLQGRSFLHDYRHGEDPDGALLELIMTAPMVVTHWINLQYYASTVDNRVFGSGNKVLHDVVGGHLGVREGNGGDLRIGLPMQSLHDGSRWVHAPLRLAVFIEAPREAIARVIAAHEVVRQLIENSWLTLTQFDPATGRAARWRTVAGGGFGWVEEPSPNAPSAAPRSATPPRGELDATASLS